MKKSLILLIGFVIPAFVATAQKQTKPGPIEVYARYDKKKDVTSLSIGHFVLWQQPGLQSLTMNVFFECPKKTIKKPDNVSFSFHALSDEGLLFPTATLTILADDQRFEFGKMKGRWDGPSGGIMIEDLETPVPYQRFSEIAQAKKVTMVVADRNYELSAQDIRALRNFHGLMQHEGQEIK